MKSLVVILLCIGIIMVVTGYNKSFHKKQAPQIEYRYVPRTFFEEQTAPTDLKKSFSSMFDEPSNWMKYPLK